MYKVYDLCVNAQGLSFKFEGSMFKVYYFNFNAYCLVYGLLFRVMCFLFVVYCPRFRM